MYVASREYSTPTLTPDASTFEPTYAKTTIIVYIICMLPHVIQHERAAMAEWSNALDLNLSLFSYLVSSDS